MFPGLRDEQAVLQKADELVHGNAFILKLAPRFLRGDSEHSRAVDMMSQFDGQPGLCRVIERLRACDIEDQFCLRRELVDVLSSRAAAPGKPELDLTRWYDDMFRDDEVFAHAAFVKNDGWLNAAGRARPGIINQNIGIIATEKLARTVPRSAVVRDCTLIPCVVLYVC
jgi:hypothetical protein